MKALLSLVIALFAAPVFAATVTLAIADGSPAVRQANGNWQFHATVTVEGANPNALGALSVVAVRGTSTSYLVSAGLTKDGTRSYTCTIIGAPPFGRGKSGDVMQVHATYVVYGPQGVRGVPGGRAILSEDDSATVQVTLQ